MTQHDISRADEKTAGRQSSLVYEEQMNKKINELEDAYIAYMYMYTIQSYIVTLSAFWQFSDIKEYDDDDDDDNDDTYTPCRRKKQATLIFAITSPSVEIFLKLYISVSATEPKH